MQRDDREGSERSQREEGSRQKKLSEQDSEVERRWRGNGEKGRDGFK